MPGLEEGLNEGRRKSVFQGISKDTCCSPKSLFFYRNRI
jgi:hypothetical protein